MVFADASVPQMTFVFLVIVAALATSLVLMFCALERSERMGRLRGALVQRIERRMHSRIKSSQR